MNLLGEEDDGLQLFLPSKVQAARNFAYNKEVEKKKNKREI